MWVNFDIAEKMYLVILSILCQLLAVTCLKQEALMQPALNFVQFVFQPLYWLSLVFFGLQAVFWQKSLHKYDLLQIYPINSLIYPASIFLGWFLFAERITFNKIVGSCVVLAGVWLYAHSKERL